MKKLLNPIEFFGEKKLLTINLIVFIAGTTLAVFMKATFGSPIDLHFASEISVLNTLLSNISAILMMTAILFISGKIINLKTRFIDCLNLSLYLRIPYYFLTFWNITGTFSDMTSKLLNQNSITELLPSSTIDMIVITSFSILSLIALALKALIVYFSFKTISNAKKIADYLILVGVFLTILILSLFLF